MISQTAEYALRAMVALAEHPTEPRTAEALSDSIMVPVPYLHKILRELAHSKLLRISRGRHGGFTLARRPEELSLLEIIDAIAPIQRMDHCPAGLLGHDKRLCPLHKQLDDAIQSIRVQFQNTSIADLLRRGSDRPPLCKPADAGADSFPV